MELLIESNEWVATKEALLEGLNDRQRKLVAPAFDSYRKELYETTGTDVSAAGDGWPGLTGTPGIAAFQKVVLPMIRRIIPGTIATELVGVQPMHSAIAQAFSLRYKFAQSVTTTTDSDTGTEIPGSNIVAGDEVFGNNSKMARFYSSADGGTTGYPPVAAGTSDGNYSLTSDYEGFGGRELTLEVMKQVVVAGSRKLQAKWTIEAGQDLKASHGLNIEAELTAGVSAAIVNEVDNEIINDLVGLAGTVRTYDQAGGTFTGVPTFVGDRHAVLGSVINEVANEIARKTRKGPANWIVVSPVVVSALQSASKSVFAPAVSGSFEGPNGTRLVGTLNGSIKVYSYVWHSTGSEPILVGYKGGNNEMDAGYFYCPYIPLMASGVVQDPHTFNSHISLMTRYGKAVFVNTQTSLGNSADYYGRINVNGLSFL